MCDNNNQRCLFIFLREPTREREKKSSLSLSLNETVSKKKKQILYNLLSNSILSLSFSSLPLTQLTLLLTRITRLPVAVPCSNSTVCIPVLRGTSHTATKSSDDDILARLVSKGRKVGYLIKYQLL